MHNRLMKSDTRPPTNSEPLFVVSNFVLTLLFFSGLPGSNQQGKHINRPLTFTEDVVPSIIDHIKSFRGRQSHYALHDTRKLYLPEELNILKMYEMYTDASHNTKFLVKATGI